MLRRFDQIGKKILRGALEPGGTVANQLEVPAGDAQAIDTWFEPAPGREAELERAGLLGRMAAEPTMFEPFHVTPSIYEFRACLRKQLVHDHNRELEAAKREQPRPPFPRLWAIATGRPQGVLRSYGLVPIAGWPPGFYDGHEADARGVVVLRELPCARETLLLRLMGAGGVLHEALAELGRLPEDAWERQIAVPPLVAARFKIPQDAMDAEEREFVMDTQDLYEVWKQKFQEDGREQGVNLGLERGVKQTLLAVYDARFGAMPAEIRTAIDATHDLATLERWSRLMATQSPQEIAAALRAS
jgi:hypothetical protein